MDILTSNQRNNVTKILINVPDEMLEKLDRKATEDGMNRSEAVRWALRAWLTSPKYVPPIHRPGHERIRERMLKASRLNVTSEPAEVLIRRDRESH
jgi:Arc/MetJ-type ribon-helix-helix transcriptional regulator